MRFLALSAQAAYALLAAVTVVILLLYALKPRTRRVTVSSMLLWRRMLVRRRPGAARRRWLLSLFLALGAGLSIALALTRPELPGVGGVAERIVLVLDNSPSMAARTMDGKSRWRHAIEQAKAVVQQAGADSQVLVMDTMGYAGLLGFVRREPALASLAQLPVATFGTPHIPPLPADVAGLRVHLFTDGVGLPDFPAGVQVHSSFEPVDNVALTAFEVRPLVNDPTRCQAFVQILNASPTAKRVNLVVAGEPRFTRFREVEIPAGETVEESFDITEFDSGVLRAQVVTQGDGFDLDDVAYAVVAPHRTKRVLLVTAGNPFLEDSIRSLPGVRLTTRTPPGYGAGPAFDAYVFDRFAPREPPPAGALLFRPPAADWLSAMPDESSNPAITGWDETSPLTTGVAWRDVRLGRAALGDLGKGVVLGKGRREGALIIAVGGLTPRIQVGFALQDSNFHMQPGFPVFLGNALSWLTTRTQVPERDLGTIEVAIAGAQVRDADGNRLATARTAAGTSFQAPRPGVYSVSGIGGDLQVVANIRDPSAARINGGRFANAEADRTSIVSPPRAWSIEPRVLLLVLGAALLILEWATFSRRITV